ncbi:hypothetical protein AV947_gp23 [Podophage Lau218]|uniref:Putative phage protein n=2 Tax=Lauvirus lau218 TaxID=1465639 RepID=A0A060BRQ4_9CAUD|nr:hypothetical protein AV947_gp23 [Podophage Lau218]AIA83138.1 putative phage protein [Podophage Lau218]AIA83186.1 putative phage protein [Lauvirus lau218]AIA83236.1 putative phage protein [Lauvirus lau218]
MKNKTVKLNEKYGLVQWELEAGAKCVFEQENDGEVKLNVLYFRGLNYNRGGASLWSEDEDSKKIVEGHFLGRFFKSEKKDEWWFVPTNG